MPTSSSIGPAIVSPRSLESVTPENAGAPALTDRGAETVDSSVASSLVEPPRRVLTPTTVLPPINYPFPKSLAEILAGGGSAAGFSAVSSWLTCPEQSRLRASGVRLRPDPAFKDKLDALTFGSIAHAMRAVRLVYGHATMLQWFWAVIANDVPRPDAEKLDLMFRIYDSEWPYGTDHFKVLGVEVEVVTDVNGTVGPRGPEPVLRTVRYDTVIAHPDGGLYSFEAKTAARTSNLEHYNAQGMVQTAVWNANAALVARYGTMRGVIFDEYVKTETPKVDRKEPKYFSVHGQRLALRYLMLPEQIRYPVDAEGRYPQMLHACWGKFSPCSYMSLCHEEAFGLYEYADGSDYIGG